MPAPRPRASLSLDLDNKWSYLKTHGDPGWETLPSYLEIVVPRVLRLMRERGLTITFFVVGLDAAQERNREVLRSIAEAGHEIGNHSFHHEPWLHLYTPPQLAEEIEQAEEHIERATQRKPIGFRGPGFTLSAELIEILTRRGYLYDASTFPTFLGPLARTYYFMKSRLSQDALQQRKALFGSFREGFRPARMYRWQTAAGELLEIPVTTFPGAKLPIHASYLLYLSLFSRRLALWYFKLALQSCVLTGVQPSLLLHPLDFLGGDDTADLGFFPAMQLPGAVKVDFVCQVLEVYRKTFEVVSLEQHARSANRPALSVRTAAGLGS